MCKSSSAVIYKFFRPKSSFPSKVWMGGYESEPGQFLWEDGSTADYQNFEPYYGLEFSGTGGLCVSINFTIYIHNSLDISQQRFIVLPSLSVFSIYRIVQ